MSASQSGVFNVQEFTDLGIPLVGGRLYTLAYGTTTHKTAYTDAAGSIPHTYTSDGLGGQYIALNARGELQSSLYLAGGSYDLALKTAAGATVWTRRADPVQDSAVTLAIDLAASSGSSLIGHLPKGMGAISTTIQQQLWNIQGFQINAKDAPYYAKGDGSTNDTVAIQAALDAAEKISEAPLAASADINIVLPTGAYKVTQLEVGRRVSLVFSGATLHPFNEADTRTHLIKFLGHNRVYGLQINMNYSMNYDTAIWCRGRFIDFFAPEVWCAKCAFVFGDPAWEGDPVGGILGDSEINIHGGSTNWCITSARAYGQNTIIQYGGGHQAYSYKWSLPGGDPRKTTWEALSEITFINCGAIIYLNGCFTGNFSGSAPNFQSKIQVVSDASYQNSYGKFVVNGTHIESGMHFECAPNGAVPVQDTSTKMLSMIGCGGYVSGGRSGFLINAGNSAQAVSVTGCNFYGNLASNIFYGYAGKVHIDKESYAMSSGSVLAAILSPRLVGYPNLQVLHANISSKAFSPVLSSPVFTQVVASDFAPSVIASNFNLATNVFTAPTDMERVSICLSLSFTGATAADSADVLLYVNGTTMQSQSFSGMGSINAKFEIQKLSRGSTVELRVAQYQSRVADGSYINFMTISSGC